MSRTPGPRYGRAAQGPHRAQPGAPHRRSLGAGLPRRPHVPALRPAGRGRRAPPPGPAPPRSAPRPPASGAAPCASGGDAPGPPRRRQLRAKPTKAAASFLLLLLLLSALPSRRPAPAAAARPGPTRKRRGALHFARCSKAATGAEVPRAGPGAPRGAEPGACVRGRGGDPSLLPLSLRSFRGAPRSFVRGGRPGRAGLCAAGTATRRGRTGRGAGRRSLPSGLASRAGPGANGRGASPGTAPAAAAARGAAGGVRPRGGPGRPTATSLSDRGDRPVTAALQPAAPGAERSGGRGSRPRCRPRSAAFFCGGGAAIPERNDCHNGRCQRRANAGRGAPRRVEKFSRRHLQINVSVS